MVGPTRGNTGGGRVRRVGLLGAVLAVFSSMVVWGGAAAWAAASKSPITVGLITTLTGPAAAQFEGNLQGAQARIDLQNAEGGVNGHKITLIPEDDQTSFTQAQTDMQELIELKHVFGVIDLSDFTVTAYKVAQKAGEPVVGFPSDGPEWGQRPNTNMISIEGNVPPTGIGGIVNTLYPNVAKLLKAKNMAALALDGEQASIQGAQSFVKAAASAGIKVGYENYTIPIGTDDVTSVVLAMKQAGVDGFESGLLDNTNDAILTTARQAGLKLIAPILPAGYGQSILDSPATIQADQGAVYTVFQRPVNEPTAATRQEQAAFKKYEHFSGVPGLGWTAGWVSADLFIQGLERAGANPTHASFLRALHNLKGYDADGLLPLPIDLSLAHFGTAPAKECSYFQELKGSTFVSLNGGKPICGVNVK
jgi:branched-chain amino acid transport system substrate-binding protein